MAQLNFLTNDILTSGTLYCGAVVPTGPGIGNAGISASAGIDASKLDHQHVKTYAQPNTTATTERKVIHTARGAGTILQFRAGSVVANIGAATVSIRLKKNGGNIDTAALVLDNANTAFVFENIAGFTSTTIAANDVFEVDITATAGGGTLATGVFCELVTEEAY